MLSPKDEATKNIPDFIELLPRKILMVQRKQSLSLLPAYVLKKAIYLYY